jgi:L-fuconolactonase
MFGSDWPVSTLRADYAQVVSQTRALLVGLSGDEQAEVFGASAAAWYAFGAGCVDRAR